jgi:hypothetical protein
MTDHDLQDLFRMIRERKFKGKVEFNVSGTGEIPSPIITAPIEEQRKLLEQRPK